MFARIINCRIGFSCVAVLALYACSEDVVERGQARYRQSAESPTCVSINEPQIPAEVQKTAAGISYHVRTPLNYRATIEHPLIVVYAAAGQNRLASERFTDLTLAATTAGFIVAYADHRRLSLAVLNDLATIPAAIAARWCVDPKRIYALGHSDGGTAAAAMAFRDDDGFTPSGITLSAAGLRKRDLDGYACPPVKQVFIFHGQRDRLFPGFGAEAAAWWAGCHRCTDQPNSDELGCSHYRHCAGNARVTYCEHAGTHRQWPAMNTAILRFFSS